MDGGELLQVRFYRSFNRYSLSISGLKEELFSLNFTITNMRQYLEMMIKNKDIIQFKN